jgi:hypothetical protein
MAGGNWRRADRPVRAAGGYRSGERYSSGPKGGDHLEYFRARRLRRAITMGAITSPGPLQLIVPDVPSIGATGVYPGVLTPAFVVPCGILLHALSLRQLYRRTKPRA